MKQIKPGIKLFLINSDSVKGADDEPFFGPGMVKLLKYIDELKSVKKAGEQTTISYAKCWKLIRIMEDCIGEKLVERHQGGAGGGEASITEYAKSFLKKWNDFEKDSKESVENIFTKYFN